MLKKFILMFICSVLMSNVTLFAEIEKKVKVSTNDSTAGFLNGKLVCGSNMTCVENNDGANESLQLSAVSSGSGIILDLTDDSVNESTTITEIATINDTYSIATEPSADKLRFDMSQKWPLAHEALSLDVNGTNCSAGNFPLGVDEFGVVESCTDAATQAELNAFVPATATALAANGANCGAGNAPLGVDAMGVVEGCYDVEEEANIGTTVVTGNASDDTILNGSGSGTAAWISVPNCPDSGGNHLNYTASTNTLACGTTGGGSGYNTIQDEGGSLTQRNTVNFIGSGIVCVDDGGTKTNCTVSTGAASAYDQLQEEGVNITQRSTLSFIGSGFTVADTGSKSELTLETDVNGIADLSANGMVARTGAGTFSPRTITGPASGISVTNGDGVSGDPTIALTNDLSALEGLSSTGFAVRSASDTWVQRSIAGTSNEIDVTNGSGVSGDPTLSLSAIVDLGAKVLRIPNGTAPTVDAAGEIAEDTTASQLLYGAAPNVLSPNRIACFTITDLISTDDNFQVFVADRDITVTQVGCRYEGTGSVVATIALENAKTGTGMTHTAPTCVTGNNTATFQSVTANNAITSGDGIRFDTTNTPSPTTDDYSICFRFTEDRK